MFRLRKLRHQTRGQATVELVVSMVFLITTIFSAMQLIIYVYTYVMMSHAAKEAVRYAVVHGANNSTIPSGPGNTTRVENEVKKWVNLTGMTITVTYPDSSNEASSRVRVAITSPFSFLNLGWTLPSVHASAEGRIFY